MEQVFVGMQALAAKCVVIEFHQLVIQNLSRSLVRPDTLTGFVPLLVRLTVPKVTGDALPLQLVAHVSHVPIGRLTEIEAPDIKVLRECHIESIVLNHALAYLLFQEGSQVSIVIRSALKV